MPGLPDTFAKDFSNLTHLYLWGIEGLTKLPELPKSLKCLDVRGCKDLESLPKLPESIERLDLGGCTRIVSQGKIDLPNLRELFLDERGASGSFSQFRPTLKNLNRLVLHGSNFDDLPEFLTGKRNQNVIETVRNHFELIEIQGAAVLPECKIVVLGNGGVGKTSLIRALKGLPYKDPGVTEGIFLWTWDANGFIPFPKAGNEKVILNIWDFAGQDLYLNTHRLFLETRAIFFVVWRQPRADKKPFRTGDRYKNDPVRPLNYWLEQVYSANPQAEVIIVRCWADDDAANPPGNWKEQVPAKWHHHHHYALSAMARAQYKEKFDALIQDLKEAVVRELRGPKAIQLGAGRRKVRDEIKIWQPPSTDVGPNHGDSLKPILRLHEFVSLVETVYQNAGYPAPKPGEAALLLDYLHHCGALYCPSAWRLAVKAQGEWPVIIDQRWVIEGIYELFKHGHVREQLVRSGGITTEASLCEFWGEVELQGRQRYDATAQWVFVRLMKECGILVKRMVNGVSQDDDAVILPELLPEYRGIKGDPDPLVTVVEQEQNAPRYWVRDTALGPGFGCLLVGLLAKLFGKVPIFRYGAIGRVSTSLGGVSWMEQRRGRDLTVKVEWFRESEDAYQGDIVVRIYGCPNESEVEQVLRYLAGELKSLPGFPENAIFQAAAEALTPALKTRLELFRLPSREDFSKEEAIRARSIRRYGMVGISAAGEDKEFPGIEKLPKALIRALSQFEDPVFDVLYYRSDTRKPTVTKLVSDLAKSDILVAFIGKKYLESPFCMAELYEAAVARQKKKTFAKPENWLKSVWICCFPEIYELLGWSTAAGRGDNVSGKGAASIEWAKNGLMMLVIMIVK